ncbi:MAG: exopolysaccharide biosynthesis polyprenyl glycosylphosphotransferase [Candidatus Eisenbacteria bacterium]|nr:exopolysaccharide biosynthesis polyprenyl glycosylphosphotransferase [Candidatus Eisenbacteria bacterium]
MALETVTETVREAVAAPAASLPRRQAPAPRPKPVPPRRALVLLPAMDAVLAAALAAPVALLGGWPAAAAGTLIWTVGGFTAGVVFWGAVGSAYVLPQLRRPRPRTTVALRQALGGSIFALIVATLVTVPFSPLWRGLVLLSFLVAVGYGLFRPPLSYALLKWRGLERGPETRILVVGSGRPAMRVARSLVSEPGADNRVVGFADGHAARNLPADYPAWTACSPEEIAALAETLAADQIVVTPSQTSNETVIRLTDLLREQGIRVRVVSDIFSRLIDTAAPFEQLDGLPIVEVGATPLCRRRAVMKRVFDVTATSVGVLLILPLLGAIALAIRLTSQGPILHRQTRLGTGGRPFTFYKFRSMLPKENSAVHRHYVRELMTNGRAAGRNEEGRRVYKVVDAKRVTTIGRWLRRTSLDELPQLINVLRGEMSLVGPRPCLPFEWQLYRDWQKRRLDVIPGMTGLWQVTGRNFVTFEDMVLMDLFYIANWSFLLDVKLLLRTIPVVLWGKGGL